MTTPLPDPSSAKPPIDPAVRALLAPLEGGAAAARLAAVRRDQRQRWLRGDSIRVEVYLAASPALQADPDALVRLIEAELSLRRELGERPELEEYLQRFPDREDDLRRHFAGLAAEPRTRGSADRSTAGPAPHPAGPVRLPNIPGYEVLAFVAGGGQGDVFRAKQVHLDRVVALKVLREGTDAGGLRLARFRREARAVARLDHPNIVRVYDCDEHEGRLYLSMEFVEGGSLKDWLEREPPTPEAAAALLATLARAMHYAHSQGVVHRDLKPANILLSLVPGPSSFAGGADGPELLPRSKDEGSRTPKITDFGLAKRIDGDSLHQTITGTVLGTASYMAPEQAVGRVKEVGPHTDVYALGALLYECLAGRPPFDGSSWLETLDQVRFQPPVPPSHHRTGVPGELEAIALKCLEKEPARRYPSAQDLAEELDRWLRGDRVEAAGGRASAVRPGARWPRFPGLEIVAQLDGVGEVLGTYKARRTGDGRSLHLTAVRYLADATAVERCREDAARLGGLGDPRLATVLDCGSQGDWAYVAVDHPAGGTLTEHVGDTALSPPDAVRLVERLARSLQRAHGLGVVHGGLEPAFVLLTDDGSPAVTALGLVNQPVPPSAAVAQRLRSAAANGQDLPGFVGTPNYLAPEVLLGDWRAIGPAADVYGLGALLFRLLTGRPPMEGAAVVGMVLDPVRSRTLVPPSRLQPGLPRELDTVCLRCLQKTPARRYASAEALANELRRIAGTTGSA
jgi:serine/threonine protein kinase